MSIMTSRLSGIALLIGSAILMYKAYFFPELLELNQVESFLSTLDFAAPILIIGMLLLLLGFVGAYGVMSSKAGVAGLIGFVFLFIYLIIYETTTTTLTSSVAPVVFEGVTTGEAYLAGEQFMIEVFDHSVFKYFIIFIPMVFLGSLLFGIGTLKSKAYPKWVAYLMLFTMVIPPISFVPIPFLQLVFSSGFFYVTLFCYGIVLLIRKPSEENHV